MEVGFLMDFWVGIKCRRWVMGPYWTVFLNRGPQDHQISLRHLTPFWFMPNIVVYIFHVDRRFFSWWFCTPLALPKKSNPNNISPEELTIYHSLTNSDLRTPYESKKWCEGRRAAADARGASHKALQPSFDGCHSAEKFVCGVSWAWLTSLRLTVNSVNIFLNMGWLGQWNSPILGWYPPRKSSFLPGGGFWFKSF